MKKFIETTKLLWVLFFCACIQNTGLVGMLPLKKRRAERVIQKFDPDNFIKSFIAGDLDTLDYFDQISRQGRVRSDEFARDLLPSFFVPNRVIDMVGTTITSIAWGSNNRELICGSREGILRIWDLISRRVQIFFGHGDSINSLSCSADGRYIASGGSDGVVIVWDMENPGSNVSCGDLEKVTVVSLSPDGTRVAYCCGDQVIRVWDLRTDSTTTFGDHEGVVDNILWCHDSATFVSCSSGKTLGLWDLITEQHVLLDFFYDGVISLSWGEGPVCINIALRDGTMRTFDLRSKQSRVTLQQFAWSGVWVPSHDGRWVASMVENRSVKLWRKVTDLKQVLLILIFRYLKNEHRMDDFYELLRMHDFSFLLDTWWQFNELEQDYLKAEFGL